MAIKAICRDCLWTGDDPAGPPDRRCPACGSRRLVADPELDQLSIAHMAVSYTHLTLPTTPYV